MSCCLRPSSRLIRSNIFLNLSELAEWRFAHDAEHPFRGMLRRNFKAAADMANYEFAGVFLRAFVGFGVFALVQQQVIAYTAADK